MKNLFFILITIVSLTSNAQKTKRHEIGIGVGILQYTTNSYTPANSKNLRNSIFFTNKNKLNLGHFNELTNSKFKQTPVFYYSFLIHKKIQIRAAYQYTFEYTKTVPTFYYFEDYDISYNPTFNSYYIEQKTNDFSLGLVYSFIHKRRYSMYAGVDFSLIYSKKYSSFDGYYFDKSNRFSTSYFDKNIGYTFNIPLGVKLNLSKSFNLKYEASFYYSDAFRPINRLSVNYQF